MYYYIAGEFKINSRVESALGDPNSGVDFWTANVHLLGTTNQCYHQTVKAQLHQKIETYRDQDKLSCCYYSFLIAACA